MLPPAHKLEALQMHVNIPKKNIKKSICTMLIHCILQKKRGWITKNNNGQHVNNVTSTENKLGIINIVSMQDLTGYEFKHLWDTTNGITKYNAQKELIELLPVKSIEVAHTLISFRGEIFPVISIKVQLEWELITVVYLHCWNNLM
jgi:hypothetical protein